MNGNNSTANRQDILGLIDKYSPQERREVSFVASPGARAPAWAVKVKSLLSYNVYNVRSVEIGDAGSLPVEIGGQMQAVNLAESFMQSGQLPVGTYVVISRVGDKNIFYAPV